VQSLSMVWAAGSNLRSQQSVHLVCLHQKRCACLQLPWHGNPKRALSCCKACMDVHCDQTTVHALLLSLACFPPLLCKWKPVSCFPHLALTRAVPKTLDSAIRSTGQCRVLVVSIGQHCTILGHFLELHVSVSAPPWHKAFAQRDWSTWLAQG
jgi:hypothetical protein